MTGVGQLSSNHQMTSSSNRHNLLQPLDAGAAQDAVAGILVLEDGRYLMQLRDDIPGIFYPDHWGLFGTIRKMKTSNKLCFVS